MTPVFVPRARRRAAAVAALATVSASLLVSGGTSPASAATTTFVCQPANGLSTKFVNAPDDLMAGRLSIPGFPVAAIGGPDVNWAANPFASSSWLLQEHSLRWLESLTDAYRSTGRVAYLDRALALAHDWVIDNPHSAPKVPEAWSGMYSGLRASALACLAHETVSDPAWLTTTLADHAAFLSDSRNYAGYWNQGLEQNIGLLAIGCEAGTATNRTLANDRMAAALPFNIDAQGALNEQAPGYGPYLYSRWRYAASELTRCGRAAGGIVAATDRLGLFIARASLPDKSMVQLGDTFAATALPAGDPYNDYVRSGGTVGTAPPGQVAVYDTGFVFGRSGWGTARPFGSETAYTLRFGAAYGYHGHLDHEAYTLYAGSRQWLEDAGHYGYTTGAYRDWLRSPDAHNVTTVIGSGTTIDRAAVTPLTSHQSGTTSAGTAYDSWVMTDPTFRQRANQQWYPVTRLRRLVVERNTGVTAVVDQVSGSVNGPITARQLWHLPSDVTTVVSGRSRVTATDASGRQLVAIQVPLAETFLAGALGVVKGAASPLQGWLSAGSGAKVAAPTVVMARSGRSARIVTLLVPGKKGEAVTATATASGNTWVVTAVIAGRTLRVSIPVSGLLTMS